jgi:predicted O-linked N-acetylglucosamine transferase (SPINDLY family)
LLLSALLRYDEAIQHYDRAIQIRPDYAEAWSNKGALLSQLKHYEEALNSYEHAFKLKQNIPGLLGEIIYAKLLVGDWFGLDDKLNDLAEKIRSGNVSVTPFVALSLIDNQKAQLELTKNWTEYRYPLQKNQTSYSFNNQKIRIAYISADFRSHPVGFLTVGLFESHDRSKFEIYGISLKSYKNDEFSERLAHGFDKFFKVEKLSDVEIAKFCREKKINIAVDLNGHTQDSRVGLFRGRLAPIQVNLIGHPNTMGAEFIDYIIADEVVIPKKDFHLYSERVVYLPDSFQPNDSKQAAPEKTLSRNAVGLPESGFIFCCFNSVHKINPNVFSVWMKILSSTTNSYLWMLSDSPLVKINLSKEAKIRGVDPTRLIFGQRLSRNEYMKRFHLANLFLDTLPFNGGATVSDALWSGLPILTQIGNGFQGRMAASLLRASELPELIAESQEEYVAKAIELANNSDLLINYRKKLEEKRKLLPLFDTQKYTKSLEKAYIQMATRFNQGLDPAHIDITDNSNKIFKKAT